MSVCSPWADEAQLDECCTTTASTEQKADALLAASEILYALSGRQFPGQCSETIRPCSGGATGAGFSWARWSYPWLPMRSNGSWLNIGPACGCHVSYECGCKGIPQVNLGRSDVTEIYTVNIDGAELASTSWRVDEGRYLVRTDGGAWPCCQDLSKDIGETGTWYIELAFGTLPPQAGVNAATKLACELAKACVGGDCDLPERVSTITRQGVSMTLLDPQDFLTDGRTGLYEVDLFLKASNPHGLSRRASVWSPELAGKHRRVGSVGS